MIDRFVKTLITIGPISGIAGVATFATTDLVLSLVTPNYNAVGETTSQLMNADAQYGSLARLSLLFYCVLITPFIISATKHLRGGSATAAIRSSALWLHLVFSITAALFQNESPELIFSDVSANDLHDRSGELLYAAALIAIVTTAFTERTNQIALIRRVSILVAIVMSATGLGLYLQSFPELTGLQERLGLSALIMWIVVVALSSRSPSNQQKIPTARKENFG